MSVHPEHHALAAEVARWFTASTPEIGRDVHEFWYGYHCNLGPDRARVTLRMEDPDQLATALRDARTASEKRHLTIRVDNRDRAARLDAALRDYGCQPGDAITHLALVGPMTGRAGPEDLVIESIDEARLEEWATVKLQAFHETESAPAFDRLRGEVETRRGELAIAECQIGMLGGENVAVLAYYRGTDQMVFNLATRTPYRHRGIAQTMLARWVDAGIANGCRSLMINATDGGRAAALYRSLGFTDEIYWYRTYELGR
ncbi:MAG: GNAT family N-acetyltransferase [Mycobacterium sp.]|nr:GNAT family N-acetyltransferase [Mycobacterium sp.]